MSCLGSTKSKFILSSLILLMACSPGASESETSYEVKRVTFPRSSEYTTPVMPLDSVDHALSASFGEFRSTHLHAGVDFATFGKVKVPVRAVEDGYILRVRSSVGGYGNAIYIQHPEKKRSVYAHLEKMAPKFEAILPRKPHRLGGDFNEESMQVWPKERISVSKGEIIAWSGESGAGKPHLHFEYRDDDDRPLNPVSHGLFDLKDKRAPVITGVIVEPFDGKSLIEGSGYPMDITKRGKTVRAEGNLRILVKGYDEDGKAGGKFAFTKVVMKVNNAVWSTINMHQTEYGPHRDVGQIYDIYRTSFSPTVYTMDLTAPNGAGQVVTSKGPIFVDEDINVLVEAYDIAGNKTDFSFTIKSESPFNRSAKPAKSKQREWISSGGWVLEAPNKTIRVAKLAQGKKHGRRYTIDYPSGQNKTVRLLDGITIENIASRILVYSVQGVDLKPPSLSVDVPVLLGPFGDPVGRKMVLTMPRRHKANGIAIYKNKSWRWLGGVDDFEDPGDFLAVSLPYLAPVVLVRDVTAPTARIVRGAGPYKVTAVKFSDNFSGIARESVTVESVTAESADVIIQGRYDSDRKTYLPDADFKPGKYKLRVRAMDNAGNKLNTTLTFQQK